MFGGLQHGSLVYILDKTNDIQLKTGDVVYTSISRQMSGNLQPCLDLKVNIDGQTVDYQQIPSQSSIVSYNNGNIIISETKLGLLGDVEAILHNSKQVLSSIDKYQKNIEQCEAILKDLNPLFAKDKERDEKLSDLEKRFDGMSGKIDKILTLITKE